MRWYERIASAFEARKVNRAEVGREIGITGQAVTLKLQGKRPVSVDELKVLARFAGLSVAEVVGDDAVVIELKDEQDLIELYRLLTPEQRAMLLNLARQLVTVAPPRVGQKPTPFKIVPFLERCVAVSDRYRPLRYP